MINKYVNIRVLSSTYQQLQSILETLNAKKFGKKINANDLLQHSLGKLTDDDKKQLQLATFSNADLIEIKFQTHKEKFPDASKDEFLGLILKGAL